MDFKEARREDARNQENAIEVPIRLLITLVFSEVFPEVFPDLISHPVAVGYMREMRDSWRLGLLKLFSSAPVWFPLSSRVIRFSLASGPGTTLHGLWTRDYSPWPQH